MEAELAKDSWNYDIPGVQVTVTRVAGSSGEVRVGYTTANITGASSLMGTNGYLLNGDQAAQSNTDYTPVSGVLTFGDSEMSKTMFIPINDSRLGLNKDFEIILTNAALDSSESPDVEPARLDPVYSTALVRILNAYISPMGPSFHDVTNTVIIGTVTNTTVSRLYSIQPTNAVFNFEKAHYQVTRDDSVFWGATPITVLVNREGTTTQISAPTIHWVVNDNYLDNGSGDIMRNSSFPLQPGSDYATPTPGNQASVEGIVPDFNFSGGYSGTITFPTGQHAYDPQAISFTINDNGLQQFNEDFTISLYEEDANGNAIPCGMIDKTTVTILYDDNSPPAGSVDERYNPDFGEEMIGPTATDNSHPGADGEVEGLAIQPDNKSILVGDFPAYNGNLINNIVRANIDGSQDTSFNPGSGPNGFVSSIALTPNYESVIGGAFSSYNGTLRNGIACSSPPMVRWIRALTPARDSMGPSMPWRSKPMAKFLSAATSLPTTEFPVVTWRW